MLLKAKLITRRMCRHGATKTARSSARAGIMRVITTTTVSACCITSVVALAFRIIAARNLMSVEVANEFCW